MHRCARPHVPASTLSVGRTFFSSRSTNLAKGLLAANASDSAVSSSSTAISSLRLASVCSIDHLLEQAGNPRLMTTGLKDTLVAHAAGNPRALTVMADGLLAAEHDREVLDEKLFIETWGEPAPRKAARR